MDDRPEILDEVRGLYAKYQVFELTQEDPERPYLYSLEAVSDPCFVLKFKNPDDRRALLVYAMSVQGRYPRLAADIRDMLHEVEPLTQADYAEARNDYRHALVTEFEVELAKRPPTADPPDVDGMNS
jgi:hypothetical protein